MSLVRIGALAVRGFMTHIIELNSRHRSGIGSEDKKIDREPADSVEDRVGLKTFA